MGPNSISSGIGGAAEKDQEEATPSRTAREERRQREGGHKVGAVSKNGNADGKGRGREIAREVAGSGTTARAARSYGGRPFSSNGGGGSGRDGRTGFSRGEHSTQGRDGGETSSGYYAGRGQGRGSSQETRRLSTTTTVGGGGGGNRSGRGGRIGAGTGERFSHREDRGGRDRVSGRQDTRRLSPRASDRSMSEYEGHSYYSGADWLAHAQQASSGADRFADRSGNRPFSAPATVAPLRYRDDDDGSREHRRAAAVGRVKGDGRYPPQDYPQSTITAEPKPASPSRVRRRSADRSARRSAYSSFADVGYPRDDRPSSGTMLKPGRTDDRGRGGAGEERPRSREGVRTSREEWGGGGGGGGGGDPLIDGYLDNHLTHEAITHDRTDDRGRGDAREERPRSGGSVKTSRVGWRGDGAGARGGEEMRTYGYRDDRSTHEATKRDPEGGRGRSDAREERPRSGGSVRASKGGWRGDDAGARGGEEMRNYGYRDDRSTHEATRRDPEDGRGRSGTGEERPRSGGSARTSARGRRDDDAGVGEEMRTYGYRDDRPTHEATKRDPEDGRGRGGTGEERPRSGGSARTSVGGWRGDGAGVGVGEEMPTYGFRDDRPSYGASMRDPEDGRGRGGTGEERPRSGGSARTSRGGWFGDDAGVGVGEERPTYGSRDGQSSGASRHEWHDNWVGDGAGMERPGSQRGLKTSGRERSGGGAGYHGDNGRSYGSRDENSSGVTRPGRTDDRDGDGRGVERPGSRGVVKSSGRDRDGHGGGGDWDDDGWRAGGSVKRGLADLSGGGGGGGDGWDGGGKRPGSRGSRGRGDTSPVGRRGNVDDGYDGHSGIASGSKRRRRSVDSRDGDKPAFWSPMDDGGKSSFSRPGKDDDYEKPLRDGRAAPSPRERNAFPLRSTNDDGTMAASSPRETVFRRGDGRSVRSFTRDRNASSASVHAGEPAVSSPRGRNATFSRGDDGVRSGGTEERGGIAVRGAVSRRQQQLPKHEQEHYRPHQEQQQQQGQQQQQQDQDQDQEKQSPQQQQQQPPQEDEKEAEADVEAEAELPRHLLGQKPDFKAEGGGQSAELKFASNREEDPHRLAQRQKQIDFGKNTAGYDQYLIAVPRHLRKRRKGAPMTPDKTEKMSKRRWDGRIRSWRRQLHMYDKTAAKASRQDKSPDPTTAESDEMEDSKDTGELGRTSSSDEFSHAGRGVGHDLQAAALASPSHTAATAAAAVGEESGYTSADEHGWGPNDSSFSTAGGSWSPGQEQQQQPINAGIYSDEEDGGDGFGSPLSFTGRDSTSVNRPLGSGGATEATEERGGVRG
ncbi:unnamed protein product, partial [Pylaiella littoralis]